MELSGYFRSLFEYDAWANRQVLNAAALLSEEQLARPLNQSWGSVRGLLVHMMSAQWVWLNRLNGESPAGMLKEADFQTLAAIEARWKTIQAGLHEYLLSQDAASLSREIHYANTRGQAFHLPAWQILAHLANHGTHHRGELATAFQALGVAHSEEDYLFFTLEISGQRPNP